MPSAIRDPAFRKLLRDSSYALITQWTRTESLRVLPDGTRSPWLTGKAPSHGAPRRYSGREAIRSPVSLSLFGLPP